MQRILASQVDRASENVAALQSLKKKLSAAPLELEQGLLHQYLDQESLHVKQIAKASSPIEL